MSSLSLLTRPSNDHIFAHIIPKFTAMEIGTATRVTPIFVGILF